MCKNTKRFFLFFRKGKEQWKLKQSAGRSLGYNTNLLGCRGKELKSCFQFYFNNQQLEKTEKYYTVLQNETPLSHLLCFNFIMNSSRVLS